MKVTVFGSGYVGLVTGACFAEAGNHVVCVVYNDKGFLEAPENAISINNVTGKRNKDGSMTIHFGGDPKAVNYLRIMPGWNYIVRLYRPRAEIVNGNWNFPEPVPAP